MSVATLIKALVISSALVLAACSGVPADQVASLTPVYDTPAN